MKTALTIPTEKPNISLVEMATPQDDAALLMALREEPHDLTPDQEGAPDHREFTYMPFIREANPGTTQMSIRDGDRTVGVIDLVPHETDDDTVNLDVKISPHERGRGLASTALRAAAGFAHEELGKDSVTLEIKPENVASQGAARKAGFIRTETQPTTETRAGQLTYRYAPRPEDKPVKVTIPAGQIADVETFESVRRSAYKGDDHSPEDLSALTEVTELKDGRSLFDRVVREILGSDDPAVKALERAKERAQRVIEATGGHEVFYDMVLGGTADAPVTQIHRRVVLPQDEVATKAAKRQADQIGWGPKQNDSSFRSRDAVPRH